MLHAEDYLYTCHSKLHSYFPLKLIKPGSIARSSILRASAIMAARSPNLFNTQRPPLRPIHTASSYLPSFLRKLLQPHVPNSTQLMGFLTLVISGGILLLLTGVTLTTITLSLIFFTPLIILSSPLWIPIFIAAAGFLYLFGFWAAITWVYRYLTRGSSTNMEDDSSSHVKDYAREYDRYLQGKVKDTAPGA